MTPVEIAAARKLADEAKVRAMAASRGPWFADEVQDGDAYPDGSGYLGEYVETGDIMAAPQDPEGEPGTVAEAVCVAANREFIIAARDDVPALADALTAALDALAAAEARADAERVYRVVEARYRAAREATDEAIALGDFDRADELSAAALAVARERDDAVDKLRALGVTP